jgi:hypothetical protein
MNNNQYKSYAISSLCGVVLGTTGIQHNWLVFVLTLMIFFLNLSIE